MATEQGQTARWFHYNFLVLAAAFLYLSLFVLPATPIIRTDLDQAFYLHDAMRMLSGQMIYRDFFQFTPPGTELVYLSLFKVFGVRAWIPNAVLLALGLSLVWLTIFISHKIMSGLTAYLPAILFLVFSFHPAMDGSHHSFSMLAVIGAMALLIEDRSVSRLAWAGVLCAIASFFTPQRGFGEVVAIGVFLWWEERRRPRGGRWLLKSEAALGATFLAGTALLNLYFIWKAGLRLYVWSTIEFPLKYYPAESELNSFHLSMFRPEWMGHSHLVPDPGWLIVHALVPLIYLFFFVHCWRASQKSKELPWDRLMLVSLTGFSLFLGIAQAPLAWRMFIISLPAMIVFAWYLSFAGTWRAFCRCGLWLGAAAAMLFIAWNQQTQWHASVEMPTGRVALFVPAEYQLANWLVAHTHPGDRFFDCSGKAYFILGLQSPARISFLSGTDYMRPEQVQDLVEKLESNRVRVVLWCTDLDTPKHADDHLAPLRDYLRSHYHYANMPDNLGKVLARNDVTLEH